MSAKILPLRSRARVRQDSIGLSPAQRVVAADKIVDRASADLYDGVTGSGVKCLGHAVATRLAQEIGPDAAATFISLLVDQARATQFDPEPAA